MKIKIGIIGYGNLGKALEEEILKNHKFKLIAIFSRRNIKSTYNSVVEPFENYIQYKNKIDIMLLCGSSKSDIFYQSQIISKHFDTINTFDTHSKIKSLHHALDDICKKSKTRSIICCGWDPGIFSVFRGLCLALSKENPITFWGKGISMGHSDAIRSVDGVIDGIEFTIPNKEIVQAALSGKNVDKTAMHIRDCYVVANSSHNKISYNIKNIPNYFMGQTTNVTFVSGEKLLKLKRNLSHKGYVISAFKIGKHKNKITLNVSMQSNPAFTARIMATYITAILNLKQKKESGAFSPLDIPISYLFAKSDNENLLSTICWHILFTITLINGTISITIKQKEEFMSYAESENNISLAIMEIEAIRNQINQIGKSKDLIFSKFENACHILACKGESSSKKSNNDTAFYDSTNSVKSRYFLTEDDISEYNNIFNMVNFLLSHGGASEQFATALSMIFIDSTNIRSYPVKLKLKMSHNEDGFYTDCRFINFTQFFDNFGTLVHSRYTNLFDGGKDYDSLDELFKDLQAKVSNKEEKCLGIEVDGVNIYPPCVDLRRNFTIFESLTDLGGVDFNFFGYQLDYANADFEKCANIKNYITKKQLKEHLGAYIAIKSSELS